MKIMNFTQHRCTQEQLDAGIIDCPEQYREKLCKLLTFDEIPDRELVWQRAVEIVQLFETIAVDLGFDYDAPNDEGALYPMIGGAPFLMSHLENAFYDADLKVYYAFSKRESVEQIQEDYSVKKVAFCNKYGFGIVIGTRPDETIKILGTKRSDRDLGFHLVFRHVGLYEA